MTTPQYYKNTGNIGIEECDDMNIPVNCFISEPNEDSQKWIWQADNFMPRKAMIDSCKYEIEADTKEHIIAAVNKYVVPLYANALEKLKTSGELYYWD